MASGTILEKGELTTVPEAGYLYIVYNGNDFKATVGALLQLVTKSRIGLGNVDNTSDADKPISNAASNRFLAIDQAIQTTASELQAVIGSLEGYASLDHLNQIVSDLQEGLQNRPTQDQVAQLISTALLSVNSEISSLSGRVSNLETAFQGFQASLNQLVAAAVADGIALTTAELTSRIETFEANVSQAIANKSDQGHSHTSGQISDFTPAVQQVLQDASVVTTGDRLW